MTVSLTHDSVIAVEQLAQRTGYSKTDLVNRGIQIYEWLDAQIRDGNDIFVRGSQGDFERVHFI